RREGAVVFGRGDDEDVVPLQQLAKGAGVLGNAALRLQVPVIQGHRVIAEIREAHVQTATAEVGGGRNSELPVQGAFAGAAGESQNLGRHNILDFKIFDDRAGPLDSSAGGALTSVSPVTCRRSSPPGRLPFRW